MSTEKKITLATIKSFINRNRERLYIRRYSSFDGMTDGISYNEDAVFQPVKFDSDSRDAQHTLGVSGAWFVGQSRDYFKPFEDETYTGFKIHNACGSFFLAIRKTDSTPIKIEGTAPAGDKTASCKLNPAKNGIELYFPGKPAPSVLDDLKANGWRWSRFNSCWYKSDNSLARKFASKYASVPERQQSDPDAGYVAAQEEAAIQNGNY